MNGEEYSEFDFSDVQLVIDGNTTRQEVVQQEQQQEQHLAENSSQLPLQESQAPPQHFNDLSQINERIDESSAQVAEPSFNLSYSEQQQQQQNLTATWQQNVYNQIETQQRNNDKEEINQEADDGLFHGTPYNGRDLPIQQEVTKNQERQRFTFDLLRRAPNQGGSNANSQLKNRERQGDHNTPSHQQSLPHQFEVRSPSTIKNRFNNLALTTPNQRSVPAALKSRNPQFIQVDAAHNSNMKKGATNEGGNLTSAQKQQQDQQQEMQPLQSKKKSILRNTPFDYTSGLQQTQQQQLQNAGPQQQQQPVEMTQNMRQFYQNNLASNQRQVIFFNQFEKSTPNIIENESSAEINFNRRSRLASDNSQLEEIKEHDTNNRARHQQNNGTSKKRKFDEISDAQKEREIQQLRNQALAAATPYLDGRATNVNDYVNQVHQHQNNRQQNDFDADEDDEEHEHAALQFEPLRQNLERSRFNRQPMPTREQDQLMEVDMQKLFPFLRDKRSIYNTLAVEGQMYLPPYDECTLDFLRLIIAMKKKVFLNSDIKQINVPNYDELSIIKIMPQVRLLPHIMEYLPEFRDERPPNRSYIYNIINTIDPEFFIVNIRNALKVRKETAAEQEKKTVTMSEFMYNLIVSSNQILRGSSTRAIHMLKTGGMKRREGGQRTRRRYDTVQQLNPMSQFQYQLSEHNVQMMRNLNVQTNISMRSEALQTSLVQHLHQQQQAPPHQQHYQQQTSRQGSMIITDGQFNQNTFHQPGQQAFNNRQPVIAKRTQPQHQRERAQTTSQEISDVLNSSIHSSRSKRMKYNNDGKNYAVDLGQTIRGGATPIRETNGNVSMTAMSGRDLFSGTIYQSEIVSQIIDQTEGGESQQEGRPYQQQQVEMIQPKKTLNLNPKNQSNKKQ